MIEALKRAARIEWDNIRQPDVPFAWIVIAICDFGIIGWTMVMSP